FLFSYEQEWSGGILVPDRAESCSIPVTDRSGTVSFLISHGAGTGFLVSDSPRSSLLVPYTGCTISAQVGQRPSHRSCCWVALESNGRPYTQEDLHQGAGCLSGLHLKLRRMRKRNFPRPA